MSVKSTKAMEAEIQTMEKALAEKRRAYRKKKRDEVRKAQSQVGKAALAVFGDRVPFADWTLAEKTQFFRLLRSRVGEDMLDYLLQQMSAPKTEIEDSENRRF